MKNNDGFDYFYQEQSDQFSFYRIPKSLFIEDRFRGISTDAKVLYGLLLIVYLFLSKINGLMSKEESILFIPSGIYNYRWVVEIRRPLGY